MAAQEASRRLPVRLRRVEASDADLLLAWANDPATRRASFHPAPIEPAAHGEWLAGRLASPTTAFWIGESRGRAIGQVRLEEVGPRVAELSIAVAPEARGAGFGRALLAAVVAEAPTSLPISTLVARVRPDNRPSTALFEGFGFRERGPATCNGVPCITYELRLAEG